MTDNTNKPKRQLSADMLGVDAALRRAARKVWEEARRTGEPVVYMQDGKIMRSLDADLKQADA